MEFRFAFRRYSAPFRHPVRTSRGSWAAREGLYVRLESPDGTVGIGEAAPIPQFGTESPDEAEETCRALGERIDDQVMTRLPVRLPALRNAFAWAAGGRADAPRHASLPVTALLPAGRAALVDAPPKADTGFRTFKWKVGVEAADDEMAILDDLLGALPPAAKLRLDANGAWDRRTAQKWLGFAVDRPIEFVEQPVAPESRGAEDTLLGLAADYPVPIALDESICGEGNVGRWLDLGWTGFFVVKPSLIGDVRGVLGKLAAARARVVFSSALETAVGAQAALHLAFSWPGDTPALGFGVWPLFSDPRFDGPVAMPFFRAEDIDRINPEDLWNAAS
ncbi:MAG TPA: o-succinylbenzoate synthase [Opitutaceae bacterium]